MKRLKMMHVLVISLMLCGFIATPAISGTVPADKRISLVAGDAQNGTLKTMHLTTTYSYTFAKNQMALSGKFKFDDTLAMIYSSGLKNFSLQVLLLDAQGKVIQRSNVKFTDDVPAGKAFKAQLNIPAQAKAMAFYYNGQTKASPEGASTSFWYDPSSAGKK
jgi:hypothetical protein